jgi:hypothetical protein
MQLVGEACKHGMEYDKCVQHFCRKTEGTMLLEKTKHVWKDNIKMQPKEIVRGLDSTGLENERSLMNHRLEIKLTGLVRQEPVKFTEFIHKRNEQKIKFTTEGETIVRPHIEIAHL